MSKGKKFWIIAAVWALGAGSCATWGRDSELIAGICLIAMGVATIATPYVTEGDKKEKDQYAMGGLVGLLIGGILLYVGIKDLMGS